MSKDWTEVPLPPQGVINVMSLRDCFAAAAITGLLSANEHGIKPGDADYFAEKAFVIADAMLDRR